MDLIRRRYLYLNLIDFDPRQYLYLNIMDFDPRRYLYLNIMDQWLTPVGWHNIYSKNLSIKFVKREQGDRSKHGRRINTEEKAKVVAAVWDNRTY